MKFQSKTARYATSMAMMLSALAGYSLVTAPAASAATYGCNGSQIDSWNNTYNGTTYAKTYLFWDGTYNCIAAVKQGSYYGVKSRIAVDAWTNVDGYVSPGDDGQYLYYASFKFYGKNRCIAVETDVWNLSGSNIIQDHVPSSGYFHCG
ncbi:hypothetical protein [Streptomyces cellulosae]|uniref:hypothetical protein n=1 Tax=Streptomyces cellulosae TaxID=1968 RepID=UPI0004C76316|nr:hypothetical protein [Streptomyces cellulosae]